MIRDSTTDVFFESVPINHIVYFNNFFFSFWAFHEPIKIKENYHNIHIQHLRVVNTVRKYLIIKKGFTVKKCVRAL
jgi:hypothetical protein